MKNLKLYNIIFYFVLILLVLTVLLNVYFLLFNDVSTRKLNDLFSFLPTVVIGVLTLLQNKIFSIESERNQKELDNIHKNLADNHEKLANSNEKIREVHEKTLSIEKSIIRPFLIYNEDENQQLSVQLTRHKDDQTDQLSISVPIKNIGGLAKNISAEYAKITHLGGEFDYRMEMYDNISFAETAKLWDYEDCISETIGIKKYSRLDYVEGKSSRVINILDIEEKSKIVEEFFNEKDLDWQFDEDYRLELLLTMEDQIDNIYKQKMVVYKYADNFYSFIG